MANIFDYLDWRGDLTFAQAPFNSVDNIILAQLSYLPLDEFVPGPEMIEKMKKITVAETARRFAQVFRREPRRFGTALIFKEDPKLLAALGRSRRYGDLVLEGYVNQVDAGAQKQFAALTIVLGAREGAFVTYRGTDFSLVGWKEDFNMSFNAEVPAQGEAVRYLETMARRLRGPLMTGGHSKGGNLAVYAASFCAAAVRRRLRAVYNNDGPGFGPAVPRSPGYQAVRDRIVSLVPEASVVGMLFEHEENYTVVKSTKTGILQHNAYSWEVLGPDVVRLQEVNRESRFVDRTLKEWMAALSPAQRQGFTEALYHILSSTSAASIPELTADWLRNAVVMIQSLKNLDEHSRNMLFTTLHTLLRAARNNIYTLLPNGSPGASSGFLTEGKGKRGKGKPAVKPGPNSEIL